MPPSKLSDLEIQRALGTLPGWARRGESLVKTYTWPTFSAGIDFVQRIARAAEAVDHHPDMDIRHTKITCTLSSHDAGGITDKDLALASTIEGLVEER
jgi:4a-hydroxytetrahydrobiopterin dehydratase